MKFQTDLQNADLYRKMIENIEDYAIILLDRNGYILNWNKGAEKIKQYTQKEILGKHFSIFYPGADLKNNLPEELINKAVRCGKSVHEGWRLRKDNTKFWGSITMTVIRDDSGEIIGFSKITHDLTEKKIAEDALKKSEERYHKMIAEVRDYAIILLDPDGVIENWNIGAERIKGYSAQEVIGKKFEIFYPEEDRISKLPYRLLNEARRTGTAVHEGWRVRKDGTKFWGSITITALHDDDENVIGFSKVTRDLTDKKFADDALKKSEERYHKMISEVRDYAIILLNPDGVIENWNVGAERIKGYKAEEVIGEKFEIFYSKEDRENGLPYKLLQEARNSGTVLHEGWRLRKDGSRFWGSVTITALHDDFGNVIGFSKVTRDLTFAKLAEEKLVSYTNRLEAQNSELEQFAYVASHDLQEPLRKIQTFTELIRHNINDEEFVNTYFEKLNSSARRMAELIRSLLNYSRLSRESPESIKRIDLNEVLSNVIQDFELLIEEKSAKIKSSDLPVIEGNQIQMEQLFSNLISNSLKFSDMHVKIDINSTLVSGKQLESVAGLLHDKEYYKLTFTDNGIGFDQEYDKIIFSLFQRLNTRENYPGTGIGLTLSKKIVEIHKGAITVNSAPGKGTTFSVYLPAGSEQ